MLPLHINVTDKKVLIVGGGKIATRRLQTFLNEGATIRVVSPEASKEIEELAETGVIQWEQKEITIEDLNSASIIIAATNHPEINEWIAEKASEHQLVNVVSSAEKGNLTIPKFVTKGRLTFSVSTNGASPLLAKQICEQIGNQFDEEFISELNRMYEERQNKKRNF
ncbi:NAD(P)-dependent oxidoreductase [Metabacillus herbersteinensis]|uniref:precorrin-2 dehydrogenase n=1 Tax=Metabacillus herbersteinensis TaxID=283816 RepID=A0ABV6GC30_9BACI